MKIVSVQIKNLVVTSVCKRCCCEVGVDMGNYYDINTLPKKVEFFCLKCDRSWTEDFTIMY